MDPIIPYVTIKKKKKEKKETGAKSAIIPWKLPWSVFETSGWRTIGGKKITPSRRES